MTRAIARPATIACSRMYWTGERHPHGEPKPSLHQKDAATWPTEDEARAAVDRLAPELWRMGYKCVEVQPPREEWSE